MRKCKPMIELYNEDCLEGMARYPDNYFDLVVTSPPYNLGEYHQTGGYKFKAYEAYVDNMPEVDYQEWQIKVINECCRVLKTNGSIFYNHKNRISKGVQITPYQWLLKTNAIIKQEIIWFNRSQNFNKCRFYPMTERVYWLSKTTETQFTNNINHHDLFQWKPVGTGGFHKRSYPENMVKDILGCFPKGLKVLDPFMGSGTTLIAAYDMGFDAVGFDTDPDYFRMAIERLEEHKAQLNMFIDLEDYR